MLRLALNDHPSVAIHIIYGKGYGNPNNTDSHKEWQEFQSFSGGR